MSKVITFILLSALFYFASLVERQFTNIKIGGNNKTPFKQFVIGYLIFVASSVWIYILVVANTNFLSGE